MLAQSSYHAQSSPNTPNAQPPQNTSPSDQSAPQQQQQQQQQPQQSQPGTIQTMRLRQDPPSVTQSQTRSRKRKSPPSTDALQPVPPPPPPPSTMQHTLPPAHTLVPPAHLSGHGIPPPGYHYPPGDFNPTGLPPPHSLGPLPGEEQRSPSQPSNGATTNTMSGTSRTLSQSKRAEQNRKAQRAFRERRDQCVSSQFFFCLRMTDSRTRPIDTLKHLNHARSYSTQHSRLPMKQTDGGKSAVLWSTNYGLRTRLCGRRSVRPRCWVQEVRPVARRAAMTRIDQRPRGGKGRRVPRSRKSNPDLGQWTWGGGRRRRGGQGVDRSRRP